jgi:hypothetical protein
MTDMFVVRFDAKLKSDLQGELRALRRRGKQVKRRLPPHERDLFEYLIRRAVDHRAVEGGELNRVLQGHRAVVTARRLLKYGRGNVGDDVDKTGGESTWRTEAARAAMKKLKAEARWLSIEETAAIAAACALALHAGNCSEHAEVVTVLAGVELRRGQTAHVMESTEAGHQWSELHVNGRQPDPGDVVMDAWAKGPAVFREDSRYARVVDQWMSAYHLDRRAADQVVERMAELMGRIHSDDVQAIIQEKMASLKEQNFRYAERWPSMSVMSNEFFDETNVRLVALELNEKGSLLKQIAAAGAARRLKRNVKQAAEEAHRWFPPEG